MVSSSLAVLVGVAQGARHAFEPDHLAAVSALTTGERSGRRALWLGASWGLGHATSILVVGGALTLAGAQMPSSLATAFELAVAAVLMGLGGRGVWLAVRDERRGPPAEHAHGPATHVHSTAGAHVHLRGVSLAARPLGVGLLHGLAGSGALTAALVVDLPTVGDRLLYLAVFGLGSVVGMGALTLLAAPLLERLTAKSAHRLSGVAGLASLGVGVAWAIAAIG
jgi:hypothetical protein